MSTDISPETLLLAAVALSAASFLLLAVLVLQGLGRSARARAETQRLETGLGHLAQGLREGFAGQRHETGRGAAELRGEIARTLTLLGDTVSSRIGDLFLVQANKLAATTREIAALTDGNERRQEALKVSVEARLAEIRTETAAGTLQLRDEIARTLKGVSEGLVATLGQVSEAQRERLDGVSARLGELTQSHKAEQEVLRKSVEARLDQMRTDNGEKLEQMRATVDEKLQGTLEKRLGDSFRLVSAQLEQVHRSVGEMQVLATGVGDLKRVLTNVKARGTWGEVALGGLLEQVLVAEQIGRNVEVVPGSGKRVEYAVRMPGGDGEAPLWLPIDSKFPIEDYERLVAAAERADAVAVEESTRALEAQIRLCAKTIAEKYVCAPHSVDFGILFLPTEGLFAEIIRRPGLVEALQRDLRILVAGPTTLLAVLSSLRMGFQTLAIQQQSGEVWRLLGAVRTEFGKYGEALVAVKKKIDAASKEIDNVERRQKAMNRRLRDVGDLPYGEPAQLLLLPEKLESIEDAA